MKIELLALVFLIESSICKLSSRYIEAYETLIKSCNKIDPNDAITLEDISSSDIIKPKKSFHDDDKFLPIAKGGYGFIYVNFKTKKVKKVIKQVRLGKVTSLNTCINEIKMGKDLFKMGHPMMVQGCDIIIDENNKKIKYLAMQMDYVKGLDMKDYIENDDRRFGLSDCARDLNFTIVLLKQIRTLHSFGIMHRDVKPGNVYLEKNAKGRFSKLWLIDYGFASYKESDNVFKGTDSHAPPEMLERRKYDKRIDVFSAGSTLFDLFVDYLDESVDNSPCNSTSLFLILNQMLEFNYKGDNCDELEESGEFFSHHCRLSINMAVKYFESLYEKEFDGNKIDNEEINKFIELNKTRVLLPRFAGKGFFGYYYNNIFNEIQNIINRRGYEDFFDSL